MLQEEQVSSGAIIVLVYWMGSFVSPLLLMMMWICKFASKECVAVSAKASEMICFSQSVVQNVQ